MRRTHGNPKRLIPQMNQDPLHHLHLQRLLDDVCRCLAGKTWQFQASLFQKSGLPFARFFFLFLSDIRYQGYFCEGMAYHFYSVYMCIEDTGTSCISKHVLTPIAQCERIQSHVSACTQPSSTDYSCLLSNNDSHPFLKMIPFGGSSKSG